MPLGERIRGRIRYGLDNPFTRNIDPTLVLDLPFSEGIGDTARDRSLYGNHGTIYGASWVDGKIGKALSFDGVNDYLEILSSHIMGLTFTTFSIGAWVKIRDTTRSYGGIFERGDWNIGEIGLFKVDWSRKIRFQAFELTPNYIDSISDVADDTWHQIVGTYDSATMKIYVDAILDNSQPATGSVSADTEYCYLGRRMPGSPFNGYFLLGILDEVRIYNRTLTLAEIQLHYNEGK